MDYTEELATLKNSVAASEKEFIKIITSSNQNQDILSSRLGGVPFLLESQSYPKNSQGKELLLLAQINFTDVPHLSGFPKDGLLQFFIGDDDTYGCDYKNKTNQDSFRVIYFPGNKLDRAKAITDYKWPQPSENFVLHETFNLTFEKFSAPVSTADYTFEKLTGKSAWNFDTNLIKKYKEITQEEGHRIGGYPFFTQDDPRTNDKYAEYTTLLLQIDSEFDTPKKDYKVLWGDVGVANFFIKPKDLQDLNFSDILYNWDSN